MNSFSAITFDKNDILYCHINEINRDCTEFVESLGDLTTGKTNDTETENVKAKSIWNDINYFNNTKVKSNFTYQNHLCLVEQLKSCQCCHKLIDSTSNDCWLGKNETWQKETSQYNEYLKKYLASEYTFNANQFDSRLNIFLLREWRRKVRLLLKNMPPYYTLATAFLVSHQLQEKNKPTISFDSIPPLVRSEEQLNLYLFNKLLKISLKNKQHFLDYYYRVNQTVSKQKLESDVDILLNESAISLLLSVYWEHEYEILAPLKIFENNQSMLIIDLQEPLPLLKMNTKVKMEKICIDLVKITYLLYLQGCKSLMECVKVLKNSENIKNFNNYRNEYKTFKDDSQRNLILGIEMQTPLSVSIKIDYQPGFGTEEMCLNELLKEWFLIRFSSVKKILRIRIDYNLTKILSLKEVSLAKVKADLKSLYSIEEECLFMSFISTIKIFQTFPPNDYLLKYSGDKNKKILVFAKSDLKGGTGNNTINIKKLYKHSNFRSPILNDINFLKRNPLEISKIHLKNSIAPNLFPYWARQKYQTK